MLMKCKHKKCKHKKMSSTDPEMIIENNLKLSFVMYDNLDDTVHNAYQSISK